MGLVQMAHLLRYV